MTVSSSIANGRGVPCLDGREDVVTEMEYPIPGLIRIESRDHFPADACDRMK
jgi:hypothetical protein